MAELFDSFPGRTRFRLRISFVQYLVAFCSRPEVTSDVMSNRFVGPVVPDNRVIFGDPGLNLSQEIQHEAV